MVQNDASPIIGIGQILWDILPHRTLLGGTIVNTLFHIAQLGEPVEIVSQIGNDAPGRDARTTLRQMGIGDRCVTAGAGAPLTQIAVAVGPAGKPSYSDNPLAWEGVALTPHLVTLARRARAVCFGTIAQRSLQSRATVHALLHLAPPEALRVFDINLRHGFHDRGVIVESLHATDVLKLNDEELSVVQDRLALPTDTEMAIATLQQQYDLRLIALTRGAAGSILYAPDKRHEHPGHSVAVRDTVGAGDGFTAALTVGLLRDLPLPQLHEAAAQVGAYICSQSGGTPPLPQTLRALLKTD